METIYCIKTPFGYVRQYGDNNFYFTDKNMATQYSKNCIEYALNFFKRHICSTCSIEQF